MSICSAPTPSGELICGMKFPSLGSPLIRLPPVVTKRVYQSTVASEKSLAPMKLHPATSSLCNAWAAAMNSSHVEAGWRPASSNRSLR